MKIVVNAIPLGNIATGIGRYLKGLYLEIQQQYPDLVIRFFDGQQLLEKFPASPRKNGLWEFAVNIAWKLPPVFTYYLRVIFFQKSARSFLKLAKGFDLYHEAGYFPFKTSPHVKTVFTLHDLSLKKMPFFHPRDRVLFFEKYFQASLKYTDAVITPSEFTRDELNRHYPDINLPVFPIALGFEKGLFYKAPDSSVKAVKSKFNLPDRYVLFVGTSDPRKNIRTIFKAMARLPEPVKLVVTGWRGWESQMEKSFSPEMDKNRIIFSGYVADHDLAGLYSGARVFVYPSYYEGFGLPVLEAMACGCPVICSDHGSLPEVAGDAAIICDPDDSASLASSIQNVFNSDRLYSEMQHKGLMQAQTFSWKITAQKTMEAFRDITEK